MSILNESELLLHVADLAVAFAGFAGIGTAFNLTSAERRLKLF